MALLTKADTVSGGRKNGPRALVDAPAVAQLWNLRPAQKVLYSQGVGLRR